MTERSTMQKEVIYSSICDLANHPTAETVYEHVHISYPSISKATVYRVLNQLAQNGTLTKIRLNDGADCFDHQTFDHHHARCSCCGKVFDVPLLKSDILGQYAGCGDIDITGFSIQFSGICSECK